MSYVQFHDSMPSHPKTLRLARRLGLRRREAVGLICDLWRWVMQTRPGGLLEGLEAEDVEIALDWEGEPGKLAAALVECGQLDRRPDGVLEVHDWADYNTGHERALAERERRERRARERGRAPPEPPACATRDPRVDHACTTGGPDVQHAGPTDAPRVDHVWPTRASDQIREDRKISLSARAREGEREWTEPGAEEGSGGTNAEEFLALWQELAVGKGSRIRGVSFLSGLDVAALEELGRPPAWWRETLEHVARSPYLRGEVKGFVVSPSWLLLKRENAEKVRSGAFDAAPPPGTAPTPNAAEELPAEALERLRAWCEGWTRGAGTDGHVPPAEPPSPRTGERDRVLAPLLARWASTEETSTWTEPRAAEGAAAYLRSLVVGGKRRSVPGLERMGRQPIDLEEALRRGEAFRRAPVRAAQGPPVETSKRREETPEAKLARLRAKVGAGLASGEDHERLTALEMALGKLAQSQQRSA